MGGEGLEAQPYAYIRPRSMLGPRERECDKK